MYAFVSGDGSPVDVGERQADTTLLRSEVAMWRDSLLALVDVNVAAPLLHRNYFAGDPRPHRPCVVVQTKSRQVSMEWFSSADRDRALASRPHMDLALIIAGAPRHIQVQEGTSS